MKIRSSFLSCLLLATASLSSFASQPPDANATVPAFAKLSHDLGVADPSQSTEITLALKSKNQAALDKFVNDVRTPGTADYHSFITHAEFVKRFGAQPDSIASVKKFAAAHNLQVTRVSENQLTISLKGTVADVQRAFGVQMHNFEKNGQTLLANTTAPKLDAAIANSVTAASLAGLKATPHHVSALDPNGAALKPMPLSAAPNGIAFAGGCFKKTLTLKAEGGGAKATYFGNRYGVPLTSGFPNLPPCGYSVNEVRTAYGLWDLLSGGLNGAGETIVIVDAFGSPTIRADVNLFSNVNNLPTMNTTNFKIIGGSSTANASWASETTLDVEWAHAIAPQAKIVLMIAPTNSFADLYYAELDAVINHRGVVISNSWGSFESLTDPGLREVFDSVFKEAVATGINVTYSTGDNGDDVNVLGYADVAYPGSSPYVTSVGGTSLALTDTNGMKFQTGWGNNITKLVDGKTLAPSDPPQHLGFVYGAGGGNSSVYSKPTWQVGTNQPRRALPDISWLADPYTGVEIIQTIDGTPFIGTIGGTSLAAPMFSAIWAIANQKANTTVGLGEAAPYLYHLPAKSVLDVVPFTSPTNVQGTITDQYGTLIYNANELALPLNYSRGFYSALYRGSSSLSWYNLSFGTDSTLFTKQGWDNVTGVGTPNGTHFVTAIANMK